MHTTLKIFKALKRRSKSHTDSGKRTSSDFSATTLEAKGNGEMLSNF